MKVIKHNPVTGVSLYEHNGVTFKCSAEPIADALIGYNIDLITHLEKRIDALVLMAAARNLSTDFSVVVRITKDIADDLSCITSTIHVVKLTTKHDENLV